MYYLGMKITVKSDLKSKTLCSSKSYNLLGTKETFLPDSKSYQKFFVILIALSTILIFPDSPRELENICESYNSRKICNIW